VDQFFKTVDLIKINCQAIDIAPLFVTVKFCKIHTTLLTHVMDVDIDILIENAVFCIVAKTIQKEADLVEAVQDKKRRWKNALPGGEYANELLNSDHPNRIHAVLRMQLDTFYALRDWLLINTRLKTSRNVTVKEKLMIFLHITTRPASNQDTQEQFSRSSNTIS